MTADPCVPTVSMADPCVPTVGIADPCVPTGSNDGARVYSVDLKGTFLLTKHHNFEEVSLTTEEVRFPESPLKKNEGEKILLRTVSLCLAAERIWQPDSSVCVSVRE